ncbi:S41 family peptidase [Vicingaceae bacterium]|nr:S41 family peptidase [Vicingaceae bacterium]
MKKIKLFISAAAIGVAGFLSVGFADSYFELSKNLDIFATLYKEVNTYYVDETKPGELMKTGIDAMLKSLDPYTNFIPESQIEDFKFMTTGQYGGIGALIHKEGEHVVISEPYEGFPAYTSGLMAGDILLEVDGKKVEGKSTSDISEALKGQPNTSLKVVIRRPGTKENIEKELVRKEIKIDDVPYAGMLNEKVGYIRLTSFTQTAGQQFIGALTKLKEEDSAQAIIFDLRGNGGGLLNQSINIVNAFVPKGTIVVQTKGKISEWDATYATLNNPIDTEMPVVVLVDDRSASASEIVSGALQDLDRAVIIGDRTFGKGLVQQTRRLSYNAQLKVTVAKYYIPSGRCIQKLNYSDRDEDGDAIAVADSLIVPFKTLVNKRTVYDGKGINPDIKIEEKDISNITAVLVRNFHIFDYATQYRLSHNSIAEADQFFLSDDEYNSFVNSLKDKDINYETETEKQLRKLKETAKKEKYFKYADKEYAELEAILVLDKSDDLMKFKDEIKEILENEIISRYYYQKGRIISSLSKDPSISKAIEVLENKETYTGILNGSISGN